MAVLPNTYKIDGNVINVPIMRDYPNGGYVAVDSPSYAEYTGRATWYRGPDPVSYMMMSLRNAEGQEISVQVDPTDNTVKVDVNAFMELMRVAGFN